MKFNTIEKECSNCSCVVADMPGKFAHLGFRAFYVVIAYFVLGYFRNDGFFTSMFLFALPLGLDYLSFTPRTKIRRIIRNIALILNVFWIIIGILGLMGIIYIIKEENGNIFISLADAYLVGTQIRLQLSTLFIAMISSVVFAIMDVFVYQYPAEKVFIT